MTRTLPLVLAGLLLQGCAMQWGAELQWNSQHQTLTSERSQVKLRSVQSRTFDTTDKIKIMKAAVAVMQDLSFAIDVLDEELGVISGKKQHHSGGAWADNPTYYGYRIDELIIFNTNYRSWGPFNYRSDLTRLTITVRPKEQTRSLVRVSAQYNLRAVEDPDAYQKFFTALEKSLFLAAQKEKE